MLWTAVVILAVTVNTHDDRRRIELAKIASHIQTVICQPQVHHGPLRTLLRRKPYRRLGGRGHPNFGPNFGPVMPKHQRRPRNTRDQRARRINKIENLAKSAKPRSPVQIRAAPPTFAPRFRRRLSPIAREASDGGPAAATRRAR